MMNKATRDKPDNGNTTKQKRGKQVSKPLFCVV